AHLLPGYRLVTNPEHRAAVEKFWNLPAGRISPYIGRTTWEMITGLETGDVDMLWIAATNPAVSMPDLNRTKAALRKSPFTVYQEAYYPTETASFTHLLLPATQWSEKTGVMTNSERRVTYSPGFHQPQGEALEDWVIFAEVGRRLGFPEQFAFQSSAEVHREFVQLTSDRPCDMTGISHQRLAESGPIQWPCNDQYYDPEASKRLYTDYKFNTADGRAKFVVCHSKGLAEPIDINYPFVLTVGRLYGHWHTLTRTGRTPKITQMHPEPFIEVHPRDAEKLGVADQSWLIVRSRRGEGKFQVKVTRAIAPGTVFVPMHWGALWAEDAEANNLTHHHACPDSKQPELKACAVQLIPV
ncbi:MAG: molybdopterin oxidoreductase family protein, partial [Microcoleaceae cyanobacterium]